MININPVLWGHHLWKFMHYLTLSYPDNPSENDKFKYKNFFTIIGDYLPCEKCRVNYKEETLTNKHPLTNDALSSRDNLVYWLYSLHNIVNNSLNKKEFTVKNFNDIYINNINNINNVNNATNSNNTNNANNTNNNNFTILNTVILIIILIIFSIPIVIYKKYNK